MKRRGAYIAASIALSVLLLGLLYARVDVRDLVRTLQRIFLPALAAYAGVSLAAAVLRAWRYKIFLSPQPVRWRDILMATFVRNSFVDLLPARLGSLSLVYILNKRLGFAFESAASAFVASFVYDFLTLGPFVIAAVLAVGLSAAAISSPVLLAIAGSFFAVWILILWKVTAVFAFGLRIYHAALRAVKLDGKKWAAVSVEKIEATIASLALIQRTKKALPIFILSLLIRAGKYVSLYFLLWALLRSQGFEPGDISFWKAILGMTGAELTSALPVKGLAGFGTWESAWAIAFGLMGMDQRIAILSGLGVHLVTNLFEYSLGIGSLIVLALPVIKRRKEERGPDVLDDAGNGNRV